MNDFQKNVIQSKVRKLISLNFALKDTLEQEPNFRTIHYAHVHALKLDAELQALMKFLERPERLEEDEDEQDNSC